MENNESAARIILRDLMNDPSLSAPSPELELMDLDPRTMTVRDQRLCIEAAQRWLSLFGMARIARREKVPDYYHEAKDSLRSLASLIERGEQR